MDKPGTIGILREEKNKWERRVALTPTEVEVLIREHGFRVLV
jgi:alpha-aminoadipic semialdehyde synthase